MLIAKNLDLWKDITFFASIAINILIILSFESFLDRINRPILFGMTED